MAEISWTPDIAGLTHKNQDRTVILVHESQPFIAPRVWSIGLESYAVVLAAEPW